MGKEMMIKGVNKATERLEELKRSGRLVDMDPRLKEAIGNLCVVAQKGGRMTKRKRGKVSRKSKRVNKRGVKKSTKKRTLKRKK